ncbi:MAG: GNAT family N-acetyltransferase [Candidatus Saccharibacteria bacterium]|nr:GNAT family N-acetyltransferase [Candidatus Saccharibacteria bacterium]
MSEVTTPKPETEKPPVEIERAKPEDAETICDIRDRAWLEAYPNAELGITEEDIRVNAQGMNGEFVPRRVAHLKEQSAKDDDAGIGIYVAKIDSKVVGYTDLQIDERGRKMISAMYVEPEVQGTGVGGKLMHQALNVLGRDNDIYLEVISYNDKAIGFYEHYGFKRTNAIVPEEEGRPDYMTSLPQTEMILPAK